MNKKQFKQHRKTLGLTQQQLAELMGITNVYISYLETGKRIINVRIANHIKLLIKLGK
tara:strand:+ start:274 stop:447 length:174 start_codon:yes stop_codon:yes gene_type:complete